MHNINQLNLGSNSILLCMQAKLMRTQQLEVLQEACPICPWIE